MATDDNNTERLIRIEEKTGHILGVLDDLREGGAQRALRIESHDREIALIKQAQEAERKYQALKNESFEVRLDEQVTRWVDHEAEHAKTLKTLDEIIVTIASYKAGGKVLYWLAGVCVGVLSAVVVRLLASG